jgi:hypothetical protein
MHNPAAGEERIINYLSKFPQTRQALICIFTENLSLKTAAGDDI